MLSVVLGATTITMNRGEQENLFRQLDKPRHFSYGNIHQVSNLHMQSLNSRSFGDDRRGSQFGGVACDDLVLSVLKSPLKETQALLGSSSLLVGGQLSATTMSASPSAGSNGLGTGGANTTAPTQTPSPCGPGYRALQASEDDLVDDVESAIETTELNHPGRSGGGGHSAETSSSPGPLNFLRRFRTGKTGRFEPHHRRVPTPLRRKNRNRSRSRSNADILDGVSTGRMDVDCGDDDDDDDDDLVGASGTGMVTNGPSDPSDPSSAGPQKVGVPDPYYPIALPIDQAFKAKYVFHHRRGKTVQERFYVFLEHPVGWLCFVYHFSV
ncbi:hypothetical protein quinque_008041 [Culex quinquefasciatus]